MARTASQRDAKAAKMQVAMVAKKKEVGGGGKAVARQQKGSKKMENNVKEFAVPAKKKKLQSRRKSVEDRMAMADEALEDFLSKIAKRRLTKL